MNLQTFRRTLVFFACTMLLLSPVGASTVSFLPSTVTVHKNTTAEVSLMLDSAPDGLFGYDLVIQLSHPKTARIRDVNYPSWVSLEDTTQLTAGSVRIKGADVGQQVEAGRTGIALATLTIEGTATGTSALLIESVTMQSDGEAEIIPGLVAGQVIVTTNVSTGSEGTVAYAEQTPTVAQTSSLISGPANVTGNLTGPQAATQQAPASSPVATGSPLSHMTTGTSGTPLPTGEGAAIDGSGEEQGIPWMWFLGGVVLLCAIVPVAFFLHRKRKRDL